MARTHGKMRPADARSAAGHVYVTGAGPVCALGLGVDAFASGFWGARARGQQLARRGGRRPRDAVRRVPDFDLSDYVESKRPYLDAHSRFAFAAVSLALASSSPVPRVAEPSRSGLALGTLFGNMASQEAFQRLVRQKGMRLASPMLFPHCYPNTTNSLLCIEFALRGYNQNFCGDSLCGARTLQAGHGAVRAGLADLMVVGGCDALTEPLLRALRQESAGPEAPALSEGAGFLVLENEHSVNQRDSTPICELASVVSGGTGVVGRAAGEHDEERIAGAVRSAIAGALAQAHLWEGDVGAVFIAVRHEGDDLVSRAGAQGRRGFSQLPTFHPNAVGRAFAATFPLQCTAAALLVNEGRLPRAPKLQRVEKGVELWVEQVPSSLLGDAALVLGWSAHSVVAAILKAV